MTAEKVTPKYHTKCIQERILHMPICGHQSTMCFTHRSIHVLPTTSETFFSWVPEHSDCASGQSEQEVLSLSWIPFSQSLHRRSVLSSSPQYLNDDEDVLLQMHRFLYLKQIHA